MLVETTNDSPKYRDYSSITASIVTTSPPARQR